MVDARTLHVLGMRDIISYDIMKSASNAGFAISYCVYFDKLSNFSDFSDLGMIIF